MVLFRYLASEVFKTMVAVTVMLLAIIMSGRFIKYLAQVASGDLSPDVLFLVMFYRLPNFLEVIVPLSMFIGILLAYGRLYVDSEMTVMSACGLGPMRVLIYTLPPAILVALLVGYISLYVSPAGIRAYERLLQDSKAAQGLRAAVEGRFRVDKSSGRVMYIERLNRDSDHMQGVFIAQPFTTEEQRSVLGMVGANSGHFEVDPETGQRNLVLDSGVRYVGEAGEMDYQVASFERFGQRMKEERVKRYREEVDAKSTVALLRSKRPEDVAALQWRISLALLVPVVAVLALALSKTNHRSGRYSKMFPAFLIYMIYLVSLNAGRDAVAKAEWPPWLGIWWLHGVFLLLGLALLMGPQLWWRLRVSSSRES